MKYRELTNRTALTGATTAAFCAAFVLQSQAELKLDINDRENNTAANTASGFSSFVIDSVTSSAATQSGSISRTFGALTVTITSSQPGALVYDDRKRGAPANAGTFTQAALLQDFIFSSDKAANGGFDVEISGLLPGAKYPFSIWAFDASSAGSRVSDWSANGVSVKEDYTFDGRVAPVEDSTYRFDFEGQADGSGKIVLRGRRDSASVGSTGVAEVSVFLNALRIGDPIGDGDSDGMQDSWETAHGLNPLLNDAALDPDNDFLTNVQEFAGGIDSTDPQDSDTDDDGLLDGHESKTGTWAGPTNTGTRPLLPDTDGDGLKDGVENPDIPFGGPLMPGTNPNIADSDSDLYPDGDEIRYGSNPTDLQSIPDISSGATLAVDFDGDTLTTLNGFISLSAADGWTKTSGPYSVTATAAGAAVLAYRERTTNGGAGFDPMWRDFIFGSAGPTADDGLDIRITGLLPDTVYPVTIWAFDKVSIGARRASWGATDGGGVRVVKVDAYTFNGSDAAPSGLDQYRVDFSFVTDGKGAVTLQGRANPDPLITPSPANAVFVNGLVVGMPTGAGPGFAITGATRAQNGAVTLTWRSYEGVPYTVESSADLTNWNEILDGLTGSPGVQVTSATTPPFDATEFPARYFRIRRVLP